MIFRRVLSFGPEKYPDLTALEFLSVYQVLSLDVSLCTFQARSSEKCIATLERRHSYTKDWSQRIFFVSDSGWEYPEGVLVHQEFPVRAIWSYVPNSRGLSIRLSRREEARVAIVLAWVAAHPLDTKTDVVLTEASIRRFLSNPNNSYVLGRDFLGDSPFAQGPKIPFQPFRG